MPVSPPLQVLPRQVRKFDAPSAMVQAKPSEIHTLSRFEKTWF